MFDKFKKHRKNEPDTQPEEKDIQNIEFDETEVDELIEKAENMDEEDILKNQKHYSDEGLWKKIGRYAKKAGSSVIYLVLILYYTMKKPEVPMSIKAIIAGALGYFILPLDIIPDMIAGVGYVDDVGVLMAALFQVAIYIDDDIKNQARSKLIDWFGEDTDTSDIDDKL